MAIEEFQDLDRDLAAVVHLVTEQRGRKLALFPGRGQARGYLHHFRDGISEKEVVVCDLVDLPHARQSLRQASNFRFGDIEQSLDISDTRRTEPFRIA